LLAKRCPGDGIREREIVRECEEFVWAHGRGREHLKDVGVDGMIKFKLNLGKKGRESVDWFGLAQNWEKWWAVF